jgi:hypothetical protein
MQSVVIKGDRTWALEQQAHDLQPALSYRMLEHLTHRARVIVRGWQVDENAPREAWLIPLDSEQQRALPREAIMPISRMYNRMYNRMYMPMAVHHADQSHIVAISGNPACLCDE